MENKNYECGNSIELPKYECHKVVRALKIKSIVFDDIEGKYIAATSAVATITPEENGYAPFKVDFAYVNKHSPNVGGYYVVYEDGYESFSPAKAFEDGYKKIVEPATPIPDNSSFKERLIKEQAQLEEKLTKLNAFNSSEKANDIDPVQKSLLLVQSGAMYTYLECLKARLERL